MEVVSGVHAFLKKIVTHDTYVQPALCVVTTVFLASMTVQYLCEPMTPGAPDGSLNQMVSISEILSKRRTSPWAIGFVVSAQVSSLYTFARHSIYCYDMHRKNEKNTLWANSLVARLLQSVGMIGTLSYELQYFNEPSNNQQHYSLAGLFFVGSVAVEYVENGESCIKIFVPMLVATVGGGAALLFGRRDWFGWAEWGIILMISAKRFQEGMRGVLSDKQVLEEVVNVGEDTGVDAVVGGYGHDGLNLEVDAR